MKLSAVNVGMRHVPDRVVLMGTPGVGKSTWAANAPKPIFIPTEEGTHHLDVASFPKAESFRDILDALEELRTGTHDYETAVVDTLDTMEPLLWKATCTRNGWSWIEDPDFQKGFEAALAEWRLFLAALERLQAERGMGVILVSHVQIRTFRNPSGPDYDRYEPKIHKKAAALLSEWSYAVLFAMTTEFIEKTKGSQRAKGVTDGRRIVKTTRTPAYEAKNRWSLPPEMALDYEEYAGHRDAARTANAGRLRGDCATLLAEWNAPAEKKAAAEKHIKECGDDARKLARAVEMLKTRVAETATDEGSPKS